MFTNHVVSGKGRIRVVASHRPCANVPPELTTTRWIPEKSRRKTDNGAFFLVLSSCGPALCVFLCTPETDELQMAQEFLDLETLAIPLPYRTYKAKEGLWHCAFPTVISLHTFGPYLNTLGISCIKLILRSSSKRQEACDTVDF